MAPATFFHRTGVFISTTHRHRRRGTDGFTLLELAVVIVLVGFLSLLLVNQQTRVLQARASQARQDQVVAHAVGILNAALDHHERDGLWPTGPSATVAALASGSLDGFLPNEDRIRNPYAPRPGLREDFTLEALPMPLATENIMQLSFQVWGESDARYVAGLLPFGEARQDSGEVWDVSTQIITPDMQTYLRTDGRNEADLLRFRTGGGQDRTTAGGVQGIQGVDRITFDTNPLARTDANPNSILGADRVLHQTDESADLTGLELEEDQASLLLHEDGTGSNRLRFDRRVFPGGFLGRLTFLREPPGGGATQETAIFSSSGIELPESNTVIEMGEDSVINLGRGGDFQVDGSRGLHLRLCELEDQLETASVVAVGTYDSTACPSP